MQEDTSAPIEYTPSILFQDEHYVAINKPSGLLVHKSWVAKDAKVYAIQTVRDMIGQHVFPVHRLDRATSGVLIFGLSGSLAQQMQAQWESARKVYWAVVRGWLKQDILVDHPLKGMADYGQDTNVSQDAQTSITGKATVEIDAAIDKYPQSRFSWIEAEPKQGRTHQIRRHLKHLSHPIIGDARYGKGNYNRYFKQHLDAGRLLLHAHTLEVRHPITNELLKIEAPLEGQMAGLFKHFGWQA